MAFMRPALLPEFDRPMAEFIHRVLNDFMETQEPILSRIPRRMLDHIPDTPSPRGVGKGRTFSPFAADPSITLKTAKLKQLDRDAFVVAVWDAAQQGCAQIVPQFFAAFREAADESGTAKKLSGRPFTFDDWLDMLDGMDFEVDDDNQPVGLSFVGSPQLVDEIMKLPPPSTIQLERRAQIMATKRRIQDARKRVRRLAPLVD